MSGHSSWARQGTSRQVQFVNGLGLKIGDYANCVFNLTILPKSTVAISNLTRINQIKPNKQLKLVLCLDFGESYLRFAYAYNSLILFLLLLRLLEITTLNVHIYICIKTFKVVNDVIESGLVPVVPNASPGILDILVPPCMPCVGHVT